MNFLAHLWLARATGTSAAGSILGDMLHGRLDETLPAPLALGVRIHRRVDAVTDRHPLSVAWRGAFPAGARRYAGIVLDLLCDHALALDWSCHATEPLREFAARAGRALADEGEWFRRYGNWTPDADEFTALLCSYAQWRGFRRALARTAGRLRRPQPLIDAAKNAQALLEPVRDGLPRLLGDLRSAAGALRDDLVAAQSNSTSAALPAPTVR